MKDYVRAKSTTCMGTPGRKPKVTPSDVFDLFARREDRAEPLTAPEVADEFAVSRPVATDKLATLTERGDVTSKKVGGRARVYWIPVTDDDQTPLTAYERPEDTESQLRRLSNELGEPITVGETVYEDGDSHPLDTTESGGERNQSGPERVADPAADIGDTPEHAERDVSAESAPESVAATIDGLDLPGSGAKLDARRDAVRAAVEYLRERGTAKPADFQRDVYPDYPARHTEGENPERAWWKRTVSKGLKQVAERTNAIDPADHSGVWTWTGEE